jgi:hypothetical protein
MLEAEVEVEVEGEGDTMRCWEESWSWTKLKLVVCREMGFEVSLWLKLERGV